MMPKRFRWHRLRHSLRNDPTAAVEFVVAVCFVIVPSLITLGAGSVLPPLTARLLDAFYVTEPAMALIGLGLGLTQLWGTGTVWFRLRAWISTAIAVLLTLAVAAYVVTGNVSRFSVPLMVGAILAQMFIATRCWYERPLGGANGRDASPVEKAFHAAR